ncbi:hypothetical protein H6G35_32560 [Aulosira sp. FACHB-113]|nr:hypothetical protein [Aulosira sp. FACHB-113]
MWQKSANKGHWLQAIAEFYNLVALATFLIFLIVFKETATSIKILLHIC